MTRNEALCRIIDTKLAADLLFEPNEVAVNLNLDGEIVYCWARQPNKLKLWHFKRLVAQAKEELFDWERRTRQETRDLNLKSAAPTGELQAGDK